MIDVPRSTAANDPGPLGTLAPLTLPDDLQPAVLAAGAPPAGTVLGQHYSGCYGCGDRQSGGLHLWVRVGEGVSVIARFTVTAAHEGSAGLAHGGLLTAALDETQAALMWLLQVPAVTARLETDFLAPVPVGSVVHLEARCLGVADRKIYTAARAWLTNGDLTGGELSGDENDDQNYAEPGPGAELVLRSSALFVAVPVAHFTAYAEAEVVEAALNRPAVAPPDQVADQMKVNP